MTGSQLHFSTVGQGKEERKDSFPSQGNGEGMRKVVHHYTNTLV